MINTIKALILIAFLTLAPLEAAERWNGQCRTDDGPVAATCTVTVYDAGTLDLASIFSDTGLGSAKANPFTGDANGQAFFFAADGNYDVVFSGGTPTLGTFTLANVLLGDSKVGTVTSVGVSAPVSIFDIASSPVTTSGTIAITLDTQSPNTIFAGPGSGLAAVPTFRALVDADIPDLSGLSSGLAAGCVEVVGGVLTSLGSSCGTASGTVTSVGLSMPADFSVAGSPLTSSGTLAVTYASQSQNTIFAGPSSGTGVPAFRALVSADIPNLDTAKITTGTFANVLISSASVVQHEGDLTLGNLLGTLGVTKGGTGLTALALGDIWYGSAADTASRLTGNTSATKMYLSQTGSGASSAAPVWGAIQEADLPSSINAAKIGGGLVSTAEFDFLNGITSAVQTQIDGKIASTRSLTAGAGLSGGGDLSADRTFAFDATELDSLIWGDGSAASFTWTWDILTGTDPIVTFTAGTINVSTGALQVAGSAVLTAASTHTLLGATHSDTDPQGVTRGSMVIGNATPAWTELTIGTANQVLATDGTDPAWTTLAKAHLPAAIGYEDEANTFTLGQVIDGTTDVIQLRVQGHSTQTNDIFLVEDSAGNDILKVSDTIKYNTRIEWGNFIAAASAATLVLNNSSNLFAVSGTTTITNVSPCTADDSGQIVVLKFDTGLTLTDGGNLTLAGNFVSGPEDTITMVCGGTNWLELSRSDN